MNKVTAWIVVLVVVVGGGWLFVSDWAKNLSASAPVKMGFIAPLTGEAASYGETEKNALQLAVEEINKNVGMNGRPIEIIYEDGKCNGKDALGAIQKLIVTDKVKIVFGGVCSSETLAAAPIAEQNKVLLFSAFSSNPAITNLGDYIFRNSPSDADVGKLDAETIAAKYKRVALLSENTDYAQGVRSVMKSVFGAKSVEVVFDESFGGGVPVSDFRSTLTRMLNAHPEVLYVNPTSPKAGGLIVKQLRELGSKLPVHANFSLASADARSVGGTYLNGVVISDASSLSDRGKDLIAKYKARFGKDPANEYEMGASYDRVYIIRDAIRQAGFDVEGIKAYLYNLKNYQGTIGTYGFDNNGDVVGVGFTNFVIKGDGKVPYAY